MAPAKRHAPAGRFDDAAVDQPGQDRGAASPSASSSVACRSTIRWNHSLMPYHSRRRSGTATRLSGAMPAIVIAASDTAAAPQHRIKEQLAGRRARPRTNFHRAAVSVVVPGARRLSPSESHGWTCFQSPALPEGAGCHAWWSPACRPSLSALPMKPWAVRQGGLVCWLPRTGGCSGSGAAKRLGLIAHGRAQTHCGASSAPRFAPALPEHRRPSPWTRTTLGSGLGRQESDEPVAPPATVTRTRAVAVERPGVLRP
jgi:hypothetical protein